MSTEMNATETVQRARGRKPCPGHKQFKGAGWPTLPCDGWVNPEINELCRTLPDPLADTPEGWWEFGQILEWAEQELPGDAFRNMIRSAVWDMSQLGLMNAPAPKFRAAFIEALAEAVGGTA